MLANGLIRKKRLPVKVLGEGELTVKLTVKVDAVSKSAKEKIEKGIISPTKGSVVKDVNRDPHPPIAGQYVINHLLPS